MSLPHSYNSNFELYLEHAVTFLKTYKWIFISSNTQFIASGCLKQIPSDWIDCLSSISTEELNEIPFDYINESWPQSLKQFLLQLKSLKPPNSTLIPIKHEQNQLKYMSPKKGHEIIQLSQQINEECQLDINIIVDMGCGLGYLSQTLNDQFNYKVLGIEAESDRVLTARKRQKKYFGKTIDSVKYSHHFIGPASATHIEKILNQSFAIDSSAKMAIVGLHACADLTLTAIDLFLKMNLAQKIIIMPCCYHKMAPIRQTNNFENIPKSTAFKNVYELNAILNRPFLRLASQQNAVKWKQMNANEHQIHGLNMFQRAALDAILKNDEIVAKKQRTENDVSFGETGIFENYSIFNKNTKQNIPWKINHVTDYKRICDNYPNGSDLAEFLTCLQTSIQSVCENVVLLDKVCYVNEMSQQLNIKIEVNVKKLMNEDISPRCFALICNKI